jgi:hypothetical protein
MDIASFELPRPGRSANLFGEQAVFLLQRR